MHLAHGETLAVEAPHDDAAALGAEVDGDHRRHQASSPGPSTAEAWTRCGSSTLGRLDADDLDAPRAPGLHLFGGRARVGHDRVHLLGGDEREEGRPVPLRAVEDADDALARIGHLPLDPHLVRVQVHEPAVEAQAARAEEALADPRRTQHVGAEVADERHRVEPEHAAGDEHGDPRRVGERCRDQEAVGDDDELLLRAQLERQVVRGRARVERDRLALVHHGRRGPGDGLLALDLEAQPEVEAELRLAALQRPDAAADAGDEPLPRQLAEVAPDRDFRNRERFRKFRNVNGIARLEHPQDLLHPLVLRQIRHALGH